MSADDAVDAVYTWVDGRDRTFREALRFHAPASGSGFDAEGTRPDRFRDNGELRFSMRSLLRHAPWVRRIHVLTNGQAPPWLDLSKPRVRLVTHREVFRDLGLLPSFNSNAIEMHLHRIPGLARRFLYLNDDVFLGAPVAPGDFFLPDGGQRVFLQDAPLPSDTRAGSARDRSCAHTQRVADRVWGPPPAPRLLPAHAPQPYDRDRLARLEELIPVEFHLTASHRLRAPDDLVLAAAYSAMLAESAAERGRHATMVLRDPSSDYRLVMLAGDTVASLQALAAIRRAPPRFFCVNDDLHGGSRYHPTLLALRAFLRLSFPERSEAERRSRRGARLTTRSSASASAG